MLLILLYQVYNMYVIRYKAEQIIIIVITNYYSQIEFGIRHLQTVYLFVWPNKSPISDLRDLNYSLAFHTSLESRAKGSISGTGYPSYNYRMDQAFSRAGRGFLDTVRETCHKLQEYHHSLSCPRGCK